MGKSHSIAEKAYKANCQVDGKYYAQRGGRMTTDKIPLSNDTVHTCVKSMANNMEE